MSHYEDFQTQIKNPEGLIRALCRCVNNFGQIIQRGWIENHKNPQYLYGHQGDRRNQKAHIIIRRNHVDPHANDIGFVMGANGNYTAIISEYDRGSLCKDSWLSTLYTYYNIETAKMALEARGRAYVEEKDSRGRIRLRSKFQVKQSSGRVKVRS